MSDGTIVFYAITAAFVVFVVSQLRAWLRDRGVKRGERRSPVVLDPYAAKQRNLETARETLRNRFRGPGG
jgi:hypothetical protein